MLLDALFLIDVFAFFTGLALCLVGVYCLALAIGPKTAADEVRFTTADVRLSLAIVGAPAFAVGVMLVLKSLT